MKRYPCWICFDCGRRYGKHRGGVSAVHDGVCVVCMKFKGVTEPRDFGYPKIRGFKEP